MTLYFGGAAVGSLVAVYPWQHWGWSVCVAVGLAMAILSFIIDRIDFYAMKKTVIKE